jgi:hypothetical protein
MMSTGTRRACTFVASLFLGSLFLSTADAWMIQPWQTNTPTSSWSRTTRIQNPRMTSRTSTIRFLSDLPRNNDNDNDNKNKNNNNKNNNNNRNRNNNKDTDADSVWWWKPPPPPEDQLALSGDVLSLFVYSFSDHFVCHDIAEWTVRWTRWTAASTSELQAAAFQNEVAGSGHLPVWLETDYSAASTFQADTVLQVQLQDHLVVQYSPVLQTAGAAAVIMAACWLAAGYLHSSFCYKNTVDCPTHHTLAITAQTWLTSCALLLGITAAANQVVGIGDFGGEGGITGIFTRGDLDYIFDSLSVLVMWRFLMSWMLGNQNS